MNIAEVLRQQAAQRGEHVALVAGDERVSFAALDQAAGRAAARLGAAGLAAGDTALVFVPMSISLYVWLIGLFRLGVTAMFVDPAAGRAQLDASCRLARPRGFVAVRKAHLLRLTSAEVRRIPVKVTTSGVVVMQSGCITTTPEVVSLGADTPALLTFTSGSTGEPKGAMRTHGFLLAQHRVIAADLALRAGDVDLTTLPVFVLANLASGATSVIAAADLRRPGDLEPAPLIRQIWAHRPKRMIASPAFVDRLVSHAQSLGTTLDSFEHVYTGGAPVFPTLLANMQRTMPRARVVAVYGSTEAEPIAHVAAGDISDDDRAAMLHGAGLLAGAPVPSIQLRVIADRFGQPIGPFAPDAFALEALETGKAGEIVVSGDHVLTGYYLGKGDRETKFRVGDRVWHRTGDAGYLDDGGRVWLLGRCSARIDDAFGRVYPLAVECAAHSVPGVRRAALALVNGRRVLVVELDPIAASEPDAESVVHAAVAWADVSRVLVVDRIPVDRRHNAKIDYPALAARLRRRGTRDRLSSP